MNRAYALLLMLSTGLCVAASAYAAPGDAGSAAASKSASKETRDGARAEARAAVPPPLVFTWSAKIGSTAGDDGAIGYGQIAVRGPLIAVASRGVPGVSDELDGVHVLDGRSPPLAGRADHRVRFIPSTPQRSAPTASRRPPSNAGATDAIGVALDGDFVVFGTFGGSVRKVRLDGVPLWTFEAWPARTRPGLPALADLDRDGVRDVIVPVVPTGPCAAPGACRDVWSMAAIVLDGRTGKQAAQRRVGEGLQAFGHPLWSCGERIVTFIAARQDFVVTCAGSGGETERRGARAGTNGFVSRLELLVQAGAEEPLQRERALGSGDSAAVVEGLALLLSGSGFAGDPDSWLDAARLQLGEGAQSPVSLGDVNGDGRWDALVVQNGELVVYATGQQGSAALTLWRGDSAASGEVEPGDWPPAYASRVGARDTARWLKLERPPSDAAFTVWAGKVAERKAEPVVLPGPSATPSITTVLSCDESRYALNEGELLEFSGTGWRRTIGSPWPIRALGCADGNLVLETSVRVGEGASSSYALASSTQWKAALRSLLLGLLVAVIGAAWFLFRQRASSPQRGPSRSADARRAVVDDLPRSRVADAHPSQARLLRALLNMLDNDDTRPPLTLALFGEWGSGKSSLMGMLRSELKQTGRYIDVWFNAWRFQREPELAPALLQCIVDEVGRQTDWVTRVALLWQRIRSASLSTVALCGAATGALAIVVGVCVKWLASGNEGTGMGGQVGAVVSLLALLATGALKVFEPLTKVFAIEPAKLLNSKDGKQRVQFVREFSAEFERIARRLPRGTRLCIFLDDLDRCTPARIVEVLETLSMLADTGCAYFVLAIDPTTVRRAVELQYKDLLRLARREDAAEARNFGVRYLEKMITLGVSVPALAAHEVEPDHRLAPMPARPSFLSWLRSRVLPEPPLLLALGVLTLGVPIAVEHTHAVDDFFGALMHATFHDAGIKPKGLEASVARPPAPTSVAAPQPSKTSDEGVRTFAQALETTRTAPVAVNSSRAPIAAPQLEPALVTAQALEPPSAARRLARILTASMIAFAALSLAAIAALLLSERRRRKRIDVTRPFGKDSSAFATALAECKRGLPPNPRNVVRFTNASRFLYHVVAASDAAVHATGWERDFFAEVLARWSGARAGAAPQWLRQELNHWLPAARSDDATSK